MKHLSGVALLAVLATVASADLAAKGKQAQAPQPDMCIVPPGAQPLLPAKLLPGMGITKDFPVTTTSEQARTFFLQGVSQIHSFWFQESERSCTQALEFDKDMAMAYWCIAPAPPATIVPPSSAARAGRWRRAGRRPSPAPTRRWRASTAPRSTRRSARARRRPGEALRDCVTPRERLYIDPAAPRAGQKGRRRRGYRHVAPAGRRAPADLEGEIDARPPPQRLDAAARNRASTRWKRSPCRGSRRQRRGA
jgi:hypothetical protein